MARSEQGAALLLIVFCFISGIHATRLQDTPGNWTWTEAVEQCEDDNARLAYLDEVTAPITMSDDDIMGDDVILWINDRQWTSVAHYLCDCQDMENRGLVVRSPGECASHCTGYPQFFIEDSTSVCMCEMTSSCHNNQSDCTSKYQMYQNTATCLVMFGNRTYFKYNAKFVNCSMMAGSLCRTDVFKPTDGTQFTWEEARSRCLNARSKLIDLSEVSFTERNRSINIVNSEYYWTSGVSRHGEAGVVQIEGCVHSSGIFDTNIYIQKEDWNSVHRCIQLCPDTDRIALMGNLCACIQDSDDVSGWTTTGCTACCFGNTRDRCGGDESFTIYRRLHSYTGPKSDNCLAVTKNTDVTTDWKPCRDQLDGCICRNATVNISFTIISKPLNWEEAQEECEAFGMMLATFETGHMSELQWADDQGNYLWTGAYSPTILQFDTVSDVRSDDKCLVVSYFKMYEYNIDVVDCVQKHRVLCYNDNETLVDVTTVSYEDDGDHVTSTKNIPDVITDTNNGTLHDVTSLPPDDGDHMTSDKNIPDVNVERTTTSTSTTTEQPYTGMSPMIIGLICTVVLVAVVLTIILIVLAVLLYRFKEQKRQLNMLKGPTISYSNLERSIVISYNGESNNEDSGGDLGNLDNTVTEQMDALFVRKDEMSPDEKSEHLYDVSDNVNDKPTLKQSNGNLLPGQDDRVYTEVYICGETGNPLLDTNDESGTCRNSSSSRDDKNIRNSAKSYNEAKRKPSLMNAVVPCSDLQGNDTQLEETKDDKYDHTDSYVRKCVDNVDTGTYDELKSKSFKRPGSHTECLYDRVENESYDEIKTGVAAKQKIHYEDIELNFDIP